MESGSERSFHTLYLKYFLLTRGAKPSFASTCYEVLKYSITYLFAQFPRNCSGVRMSRHFLFQLFSVNFHR